MQNNYLIADIFEQIADILDILGENRFKIRAYRNAAKKIKDLSSSIEELADEGKLQTIPGIGKDLERKIVLFLETGRVGEYERVKQKVPEDVLKLLNIQGLGPKTLSLLVNKLNVKNLSDLQKVITSGELAKLPRLGPKKVQEIEKGIEAFKTGLERSHLGTALGLAEEIVRNVIKLPMVTKASIAGSLRRGRETIGDIDILAASDDGDAAIECFTSLPGITEIIASGSTKATAALSTGIKADLRVVDEFSWGSAIQYFTGSQAHNVKMRKIALQKGLHLNEYGLFEGDMPIASKTEEEIYNKLGMSWIPPELREDMGEIEAAIEGKLPNLIDLADIKGDLHTHSTWSDGRASIEDMALTAKHMGYQYIAITDHSLSSRIANGLDAKRLAEKRDELKRVQERVPDITILMGTEVDILPDGSLDYPDEVLKELDIVIASVHSHFKMERDEMTQRINSAIKNPFVHAVAHPTGRLIGRRRPYDVDIDSVIETAKEYGKALEVNSNYFRLDLNDKHIRKAVEAGVKIIISTDAHSTDQLGMMRLGISTARRGWAEKKDVINSLDWGELKSWLKSVRPK